MSSTVVRLVLAATLAAGTALWGHAALAGAASVEDLLAGGLVPSGSPAMLGPITSVGRKGWECKPERAAASAQWQDAGLPAPTPSGQ